MLACGHHAELIQQLQRCIGRAMLCQQARLCPEGHLPVAIGRGHLCHLRRVSARPLGQDMLEHQRDSLRTVSNTALPIVSEMSGRAWHQTHLRCAACWLGARQLTGVRQTGSLCRQDGHAHLAACTMRRVQSDRHAMCSHTCRTVAAAVLTTLSEFLGSDRSRKQRPKTAATPSCRRNDLSKYLPSPLTLHESFGTSSCGRSVPHSQPTHGTA